MQHPGFEIQSEMPPVFTRFAALALCVLPLAFAGACAKASAADLVPDGPPLSMSAPPPRVITPMEVAEAPPPPPAPEPPPATAADTATNKPAAGQQKPRPAAPPAASPNAATQPTPPPAPPPLEVRSVPSAAAAAEEKKIKDLLARASSDLNRVTWQSLSNEGKEQYAQSQRWAQQAEEALKEKNFVYAATLADKAAQFAAELAGR